MRLWRSKNALRTSDILTESRQHYSTIIAITLGVISAMTMIMAASHGKKWLAAVALGIVSFYAVVTVTQNFKTLLIFMSSFFIPLRLDFHIIFKESDISQLQGLPITTFDIAFFLLFAYWIFQVLLRKDTIRFFPSISVPALAYICFAGLSAFFSADRTLSFSVLALIVKSYLIFLYYANNIRSKEEIFWIIAGSGAGVMVQSMMGMLQFTSGGVLGLELFGESERAFRTTTAGIAELSRVGGTIGDPNSLAMYLNFVLPVLLCLIFTDVNPVIRFFTGFIVMAGGVTELLTLSRGGWMALGIGGLIALHGILKDRLKSHVKSIALVVVIVSVMSALVLLAFSDVRARLFEKDYGSAYSRIPMMKVAAAMIKDNPLLGVGLNNYATVMSRYDTTRENVSYAFPFPVHNAYLLIAAESGILALLCFLIVISSIVAKSMLFFNGRDILLSRLGIGWICGIITWMIHSMIKLNYAGTNIILWMSMGMVVAIYCMLNGDDRALTEKA